MQNPQMEMKNNASDMGNLARAKDAIIEKMDMMMNNRPSVTSQVEKNPDEELQNSLKNLIL